MQEVKKCRWWRGGHCWHYLYNAPETRPVLCRNGYTTGLTAEFWAYRCCNCNKVKHKEANYDR